MALEQAMKQARAGQPISGIGAAIERTAKTYGFKSRVVTETSDGWTLVGTRGNLSAQYEHTMIVTEGEPIVVTQH